MKTVLILGAGLTRAAHPKSGKIKRPPLDADFFDIARLVNQKLTEKVLDCLTSLVGDYAKVLSNSFETASTYLYIKAIDTYLKLLGIAWSQYFTYLCSLI